MGLKKSGLILTLENYDAYMRDLRTLDKAQRDAFSGKGMQDYQRAAKQVTTETRKMSNAADSTWQVVQNLRRGFDDASRASSSLANSSSKASSIFSSFKSAVGGGVQNIKSFGSNILGMIPSFAKWLGLLTAAYKVLNFLKVSGDVAARNETLSVTLEQMGGAAGYSGKQINYAVEQLKQQGITTQAAQQSLVRMTRAQISWAEASKLAAIAQGSAVAAGMNSSEAFERLILGIQKQEPELLDELGITLRRTDAYREFAKTVGKTERTLTEAEKRQAILNEIYKQSESVLGVYDAAMETTGKKQGSLARHIEEAQASVGKLILPFKGLSVDLQTNFWKALRTVSKGFESWVPLIDSVITSVSTAIKSFYDWEAKMLGFGNLEGMWERMGRGAHDWARVTLQAFALVGATLTGTSNAISKFLVSSADAFAALSRGDWGAAAEAVSGLGGKVKDAFQTTFVENFTKKLDEYQERFPDIFKSWEELQKEVEEVDLNPPIDGANAAIDEQTEALKKQIEVLKQLDQIETSYQEKIKDINQKYTKQVDKFNKDAAKSEEDLKKKTLKSQTKLEDDAAKQRQKLIFDYNKQAAKEQQQSLKEQQREYERFILNQQQALRRFQVQDRRLRAEGDVLALMQLREDFDIQQKEAQENYDLQSKQSKESNAEQARQKQADLQEQLQELDANIKERQQEIQSSYDEELATLRAANDERRAEMQAEYEQQLVEAKEFRDKQLEELGRSLREQGEMTEEGMQAIYEAMREVYGEDAQADRLMKGFQERAVDGFAKAVDDALDQLKRLDEGISDLESKTVTTNPASRSGTPRPGTMPGAPRTRRMRQGGTGVVTGPALFEVEPGQREAFMFAPLPSVPSSNINVNMAGGFDITGAEIAGRAATEAALDQMVDEFTIAVQKIARRGK